MSIPEPKVEHHEGRRIRSCPIFPDLSRAASDPRWSVRDLWRQERLCGRGSPVPRRGQHGNGLEERQPTNWIENGEL